MISDDKENLLELINEAKKVQIVMKNFMTLLMSKIYNTHFMRVTYS